jgi:GNAT superfamily N-acetyltransferase
MKEQTLATIPRSEPTTLRDGSAVLVRAITASDSGLVSEIFAGLSPESRRLRFLTAKDELRPAELQYLTDVDHRDHEAIVALDAAGGGSAGIARYIRDRSDPETAELAIAVVDGWQGRGLGTELISQLAERARRAGIRRFVALTAGSNVAMGLLLRRMGGTVLRREFGTLEYELLLGAPAGRTPALAGQGS